MIDTRYPGWHELAAVVALTAVAFGLGILMLEGHPAEPALFWFGFGSLLVSKTLNWSLPQQPGWERHGIGSGEKEVEEENEALL